MCRFFILLLALIMPSGALADRNAPAYVLFPTTLIEGGGAFNINGTGNFQSGYLIITIAGGAGQTIGFSLRVGISDGTYIQVGGLGGVATDATHIWYIGSHATQEASLLTRTFEFPFTKNWQLGIGLGNGEDTTVSIAFAPIGNH